MLEMRPPDDNEFMIEFEDEGSRTEADAEAWVRYHCEPEPPDPPDQDDIEGL